MGGLSTKAKYILILIALAVASAVGFHFVYEAICHAPSVQGSGPVQATGAGIISLIASALGAVGFPIAATWVAFFTKFEPVIGDLAGRFVPDKYKPAAKTAVDVGAIAMYRELYVKSTLPDERKAIKTAAKVLNDSNFETWFADDAPSK